MNPIDVVVREARARRTVVIDAYELDGSRERREVEPQHPRWKARSEVDVLVPAARRDEESHRREHRCCVSDRAAVHSSLSDRAIRLTRGAYSAC